MQTSLFDHREYKGEKNKSVRKMPLDVIITRTFEISCCVAVDAGMLYGTQSTRPPCPQCGIMKGHELVFVDNDYMKYDHRKHANYVAQTKPKYATVRDIMTKEQCEVAGIQYYELQQILDWAAEIQESAQNVILIPKYDCLDKLPRSMMLGFSIPTTHGGTPLDPLLFKDWRVHLLGGSWKEQINYLNLLGDSVVSIDNNYILGLANQYGCWVMPDGQVRKVSELSSTVINPRAVALAMSIGNVGAKIKELRSDDTAKSI